MSHVVLFLSMAMEIERKFLVNKQRWTEVEKGSGVRYHQGYLSTESKATVRVRLAGEMAWLTIKGPTTGASRSEFEYSVPASDAEAMLDTLCATSLQKIRYKLMHAGKLWEVDEFLGANEGLLLAEIELPAEDEVFELPPWVGEEVTTDARYYNSNLSLHPYQCWKQE